MSSSFQWGVVGAGPAGILTVGKLIDCGVDPRQIAWVDPKFKVGDFGLLWRDVSSNTKVKLFVDFLEGVKSFRFDFAPPFDLLKLDSEDTCDLSYMADPLQWVSDHLMETVKPFNAIAHHIHLSDRAWHIDLDRKKITAKNVVLAVGCEPKILPFSGVETVPLQEALSRTQIANVCQADDAVAVFGSSHSAILVIKNLIESGVKRVVNFYLEPLRYAVELDDWILFDNTGLKGQAAHWARDYIDGQRPKNLERYISSEEHINQYLPECNKAVYAVGFERRHLPIVAGLESVHYNPQSGIIAPGLFGIGIGFPECHENPFGIKEYAVGLWKFLKYIDRIMPVWMKYGT